MVNGFQCWFSTQPILFGTMLLAIIATALFVYYFERFLLHWKKRYPEKFNQPLNEAPKYLSTRSQLFQTFLFGGTYYSMMRLLREEKMPGDEAGESLRKKAFWTLLAFLALWVLALIEMLWAAWICPTL